MWNSWMIIIQWQGNFRTGPYLWSNRGSFFWTQLLSIKHIFSAFTIWYIGNGNTISYWYDSWGPEPIANTGSRQRNHAWALSDAVASSPTPYTLPELQDRPDELLWNGTPDKQYSAASAYRTLAGIGLEKWEFRDIWNLPIPSSIKIFLFLLLKDKLLTKDVMMRRNFNCQTACCPMCNTNQVETGFHLFFTCPFARELWNRLNHYLGRQLLVLSSSVQDTWRSTQHASSPQMKTEGHMFLAAALWSIWKQRNMRIFENRVASLDVVLRWLVEEATLWKKALKRR